MATELLSKVEMIEKLGKPLCGSNGRSFYSLQYGAGPFGDGTVSLMRLVALPELPVNLGILSNGY